MNPGGPGEERTGLALEHDHGQAVQRTDHATIGSIQTGSGV